MKRCGKWTVTMAFNTGALLRDVARKKAIVAVAHSMAIAIFHMLKRKTAYENSAQIFFDANNPPRALNRLTKRIEPEPKGNYFIQRYSSLRLGFTAPDGSIILIAEDLALGAGNPEMDKVLEATVLHELVHWCRFKIGQDVFDEGPPYDFEREAYGHKIRRTWDSCGSVEYYEVKK